VIYGDIRDTIEALPEHCTGCDYRTLPGIFPVRERIIRDLRPAPRSVFEIGALVGYFLITAIHAAPSIRRVGWCDNETHTPNSNGMALANIRAHAAAHDRPEPASWYVNDRRLIRSAQCDLVQVDGAHSYQDCLLDLLIGLMMRPRWIMVDDYAVVPEVREATDHFRRLTGWPLEEHNTENGLALLTRPTPLEDHNR